MKHLLTIIAIVVLASTASFAANFANQNFTLTIQGAPLSVVADVPGSTLNLTGAPNTTLSGFIASFTVTGEPLYNFDVTWTPGPWIPAVAGNPTVLTEGADPNVSPALNNVLNAAGTLNVVYTNASVTIPVGGYGAWTKTITCTVAYSAGWF